MDKTDARKLILAIVKQIDYDIWKGLIEPEDESEMERVLVECEEIVLAFPPIVEKLLILLRSRGWRVAIHNDYRQDGKDFTFWLFTKGNRAIKGEGLSDIDALLQVAQSPELH